MLERTAAREPVLSPAVWQARARRLRELHAGPDVLVLLNPWDRLSARLFAGLPNCHALATTSAGIAANLGYPDGQRIPLDEMLAVVRRIAAATNLPVTVDFEAGYAEEPERVAEHVHQVVAAGAVGINLEDGVGDGAANGTLRDPDEQVERLIAARAALEVGGVPGVLNARTDVLMQRHGLPEHWLPEAIRRCQRYIEAGADCVYVPGLPLPGHSPAEATHAIQTLVQEVDAPLNLLASATLPPLETLRELGVRRVSTGSGLTRLAYAAAHAAAEQVLHTGAFPSLTLADSLPHSTVNRILDHA